MKNSTRGGSFKDSLLKRVFKFVGVHKPTKTMNLVGRTFGNLKVVEYAHTRKGKSWWECQCACGTRKIIGGARLTSGHTISCGCAVTEWRKRAKKHGFARRDGLCPEITLWYSAKRRAKQSGLLFSMTLEDIKIPAKCPLLGIPIAPQKGDKGDNSPSLDRIDSSGGYVSGNVWVISWRANRLKSDATLQELKKIVEGLEQEIIQRTIHETR